VAGVPQDHGPAAGAGADRRLHHDADQRPEGLRHRAGGGPGPVQDDAAVIALSMWRVAFTGQSDFGLGSAIAVLLFVLVVPILILNIRRFRREQ
jgi:hypothetical protein